MKDLVYQHQSFFESKGKKWHHQHVANIVKNNNIAEICSQKRHYYLEFSWFEDEKKKQCYYYVCVKDVAKYLNFIKKAISYNKYVAIKEKRVKDFYEFDYMFALLFTVLRFRLKVLFSYEEDFAKYKEKIMLAPRRLIYRDEYHANVIYVHYDDLHKCSDVEFQPRRFALRVFFGDSINNFYSFLQKQRFFLKSDEILVNDEEFFENCSFVFN